MLRAPRPVSAPSAAWGAWRNRRAGGARVDGLGRYETLQGNSGPQAIFLKADPRAGRPEMPTVPQPHRTASKEGRNTVEVFDAHLNSAAQRSEQPLGRAGTARDFARSD